MVFSPVGLGPGTNSMVVPPFSKFKRILTTTGSAPERATAAAIGALRNLGFKRLPSMSISLSFTSSVSVASFFSKFSTMPVTSSPR